MNLQNLLEKVQEINPNADLTLIKLSYNIAEKVHREQKRESGDPYLVHPLRVAEILADWDMDVVTVSAGILHDILEESLIIPEEIRRYMGNEVYHLVEGVTKISKLELPSFEERQVENLRKMLLAMTQDIRVIIIKLADRLDNMRTLEFLSPQRQKKIAHETLDIYAPIAHRLGMGKVRAELEDLSFMTLEPKSYNELSEKVNEKREEREAKIKEITDILEKKLKEANIKARIKGRAKHYYSIYQKIHNENRSFSDIYDLTAVRIITESVKDCYAALGIVHTLWKPVPGRFKDFIAMPKSNMYQSLHTSILGNRGEAFEIQIRTEEMHRISEYGIAAHWKYKEKKGVIEKDDQKFAWISQLLEMSPDKKDPNELIRNLKIDLYQNEVFVFTPKGTVKSLPQGSNVIDFAYAVHTDVGHNCVGAKVNGRMVPLKYKIKNGDIIQVLTMPTHRPSRDWLKIVKTGKARTKIRQWFKSQDEDESTNQGKEVLERELKKENISLANFIKSGDILKVTQEFKLKSINELFTNIGYGELSVRQVINRLLPDRPSLTAKVGVPDKKASSGIIIDGMDNCLVHFGRCCSPIPGDAIVGFITRGRGVSIHRQDCPNLFSFSLEPERKVKIKWDTAKVSTYEVNIDVLAYNRVKLLADISTAISEMGTAITSASAQSGPNNLANSRFVVEIKNHEHLNQVIENIKKIKDVIKVTRSEPK
ncbi:MAG: bifunctional (p)ppGpp synthetase/guanosine-3',5'-bis(diphosphate) 3'-pyrophosphohydrolase [bacterium]|nr:bifunctional (p)ppGpp synthetase/guanosine-3',5'-bis(diphosphate) 3'-pyrophosphohydrolase [bacterium]